MQHEYIRCTVCGTMCYGLQALRDHACTTGVFRTETKPIIANASSYFPRAVRQALGMDMSNVRICQKCGKPAMSNVMSSVLFRFNQDYPALEAMLCVPHTEELYAWFQDSPVVQATDGAFNPEAWKEAQKAKALPTTLTSKTQD